MGGRLGELLLILGLVLLIFGTGKLRNIGTDLGGAIRDFRKSMGAEDKKDGEASADNAALPADNKPTDTTSKNG